MPVPTFDRFIEPLLRFLAEHPEGVTTAKAHEAVAARLQLSESDRAERLPSGIQPVFKNRNGWAQDRLKRAGLSESPRYRFWRLTKEGLAYASAHPSLTESEVEEIANVERSSRLREKKDSASDGNEAARSVAIENESSGKYGPEERIDAALAEIRESVAHDLLQRIAAAPPEFFENLVLDLLLAMGYGADRSALQRVGGSGDGGIDGIISLDKLGLEKVYVQAKRWQNTIGSPQIQTFMGALHLQGASKGVFITTSSFTRDAKDAATKARGTIVLVDGAQLTSLMMEHGVATSHKALKIPKIDNDYFEDG
jgi:restriction system protein